MNNLQLTIYAIAKHCDATMNKINRKSYFVNRKLFFICFPIPFQFPNAPKS